MALENGRYAVVNNSTHQIPVYATTVSNGAFAGGSTAGGAQIGVIYPNEFYTLLPNAASHWTTYGILFQNPQGNQVKGYIETSYGYSAGVNTDKPWVAEALNGDGIPYSAEAPLWNKHKVKRLLENPRYTGTDGYPAILDKAAFRAVQEQICSKTAGYTVKEKRPVLGLVQYLRCPCGGALQRVGGTTRRKDTLYLKCEVCGTRVTILDDDLLAQAARQMMEHDHPTKQPYTPSAEVVRLTNAVNRGLEHPSAPEDVISLILQGVSARYDCCPVPIEQETHYRPSEADLKRFGQAVSHITITGNLDVIVHFK